MEIFPYIDSKIRGMAEDMASTNSIQENLGIIWKAIFEINPVQVLRIEFVGLKHKQGEQPSDWIQRLFKKYDKANILEIDHNTMMTYMILGSL